LTSNKRSRAAFEEEVA